jgi:hypothetical protein
MNTPNRPGLDAPALFAPQHAGAARVAATTTRDLAEF